MRHCAIIRLLPATRMRVETLLPSPTTSLLSSRSRSNYNPASVSPLLSCPTATYTAHAPTCVPHQWQRNRRVAARLLWMPWDHVTRWRRFQFFSSSAMVGTGAGEGAGERNERGGGGGGGTVGEEVGGESTRGGKTEGNNFDFLGSNSRKNLETKSEREESVHSKTVNTFSSANASFENVQNLNSPSSPWSGYNLTDLLDSITQSQSHSEGDLVRPKRTIKTRRSEVMNIDEVVEFLREENVNDVCVIRVPPEREYVEYFVVCGGLGSRHIHRMADNLVAEVKSCGDGRGGRVRVEGRDSDDWLVVDLGSIVVHMMLKEVRERYELEKMWSLGPEYDDQVRDMRKMFPELTA